MRISDWSSDVCSSDLTGGRMGIRRAPYQSRTAPFLKALCSHALLLCSQGCNMPISSVLCRTQEALQRERAAGASLDNVRTQAIRAATASSEGHTFEPPAKMRISIAGFRLTKKTKN